MIRHFGGSLFHRDHVSLAPILSFFFYCEKYKCTLYAESPTTVATSATRVARTETGASVLAVPVAAVSSSLPVWGSSVDSALFLGLGFHHGCLLIVGTEAAGFVPAPAPCFAYSSSLYCFTQLVASARCASQTNEIQKLDVSALHNV
jgi:hypothetical protein